jgi:hypothetical protein
LALISLVLCTDALAAQPIPIAAASFSNVAEGIGAAVGAAVALLGAPGVYLGIKKSQAEIRKLELEALNLQAQQSTSDGHALQKTEGQTLNVVVEGVGHRVAITHDPRLLAPLLLLLDFVVATIVVTVAGYLLNFGELSLFSPLLALAALMLFTPIFREARRLKRVLTATGTAGTD